MFVVLIYLQLVNVGDEVLLFYNDKTSFQNLVELMGMERHRMDPSSPLMYHINLVQLLACCTEGKNVYTEIKCHSLLPLDDIVRVVTHSDCLPEVGVTSTVKWPKNTVKPLLSMQSGDQTKVHA